MFLLELYFQSKHLSSLVIAKKPLFWIGRAPDCDLILPDLEISRKHCLIRNLDGRLTIESSSQNPIYCGDMEIPSSRFPLQKASFYKLSRQYSFRIMDSEEAGKTLIRERRKTQMIVLGANEDSLSTANAVIEYKDAKALPNEISVGSDGLSIGQHPRNDLVLSHPSVSQFHCRLEFKNNAFLLTDLSSTNGTFIESKKIIQTWLADDAEILVGQTPIRFRLKKKTSPLKKDQHHRFFGMVSKSEKMQRVFSWAEIAAPTEAPIFIQGETGTGKELLARALHDLSDRFEHPLITINCASLPANLIESELFGHEKGAFTNASETRIGAFEAAHEGSLFLDEIGELNLDLQAKLLRTLESGEVKRIGSNKNIQTDVRIISATHRDLRSMVEQGKFREDLYFRLHVVPIVIPPLRERKEDIDILVQHLLELIGSHLQISPEALSFLKTYHFPGNIRELKNILQRSLIESQMRKTFHSPEDGEFDPQLLLSDFKFVRVDGKHHIPGIADERSYIYQILEKHNFNQSEAAKELGMAISSLHDKLKKVGINLKEEKRRIRKAEALAS